MDKARLEEGQSVEAGLPPAVGSALSRDQWIAETRRLLVEKYAIQWPANEVAEYAAALAETYYDEPDWRENPDDAIDEDFRAGL